MKMDWYDEKDWDKGRHIIRACVGKVVNMAAVQAASRIFQVAEEAEQLELSPAYTFRTCT